MHSQSCSLHCPGFFSGAAPKRCPHGCSLAFCLTAFTLLQPTFLERAAAQAAQQMPRRLHSHTFVWFPCWSHLQSFSLHPCTQPARCEQQIPVFPTPHTLQWVLALLHRLMCKGLMAATTLRLGAPSNKTNLFCILWPSLWRPGLLLHTSCR